MAQNVFKKLMVLVSLTILASATVLADASFEGEFFIDGQWRKGTLMSKGKIRLVNGVAYPDPPYAFVSDDVPPYVMGDNQPSEGIPWRNPLNKMPISNLEMSVSDYNGITVTCPEALDISIYNTLGECVYSATDKNNASVDRNTLREANGMYMLHLVDKDGNTLMMNFMFSNGSFVKGVTRE